MTGEAEFEWPGVDAPKVELGRGDRVRITAGEHAGRIGQISDVDPAPELGSPVDLEVELADADAEFVWVPVADVELAGDDQ